MVYDIMMFRGRMSSGGIAVDITSGSTKARVQRTTTTQTLAEFATSDKSLHEFVENETDHGFRSAFEPHAEYFTRLCCTIQAAVNVISRPPGSFKALEQRRVEICYLPDSPAGRYIHLWNSAALEPSIFR